MERTRRRFRYRTRQQADVGGDDEEILQSIKPIELNGRRSQVCGLRKLLVYTDQDEVVVSVVTNGGTLECPDSRNKASKLAAASTQQLVAPIEVAMRSRVRIAQEPEQPLRRRRLGR